MTFRVSCRIGGFCGAPFTICRVARLEGWLKGLVGTALAVAVLAGCSSRNPGGSSSKPPLTLGNKTPLTTQVVDPSGGTVTVSNPGGALDGLSVEVPAGAYSGAVTVALSYQAVTAYSLRAGFEPASPLVEIDTGGQYADQIMVATIPAEIPDGYFGMPFYYDAISGRMEAVPVVAQDANSVTLATNHFCHILITRILLANLQNQKKDTNFKPGEDDWQVENYGSYISPVGNCHGLSLGAIWYYVERHLKGEEQLNGRYDSHGLPEGKNTRGFSVDDDAATKLVSIIQKDIKGNDFVEVTDRFDTAGARLTRDELHFYATVAAILYTGEPQGLGLYSSAEKAAHAVVCYKIDKDTLYVADPNYIGNTFLFVALTNKAFDAYMSAENLGEVLAGNFTAYNQISFTGQTSLYRWDLMGSLWTEMESGTIGRTRFPHYALRVTERDRTGAVTDQYELDLLNDHHTSSSSFEVSVDADFESKLVAYKYVEGATPDKQSTTTVTLDPGENMVGYLILGKPTEDNPKREWFWVGFEWVTVVYTADAPQVSITAPANGATFTVGESITFSGSATDAGGNALAGASLVWSSDTDGQLGTGGSISTTLSVGPHTVTLTATDSTGKQGQARISVSVSEEAAEKPEMQVLHLSTAVSNGGSHTISETATTGLGTVVEFTIRNNGLGELDLNGVQIGGADAADYAVTTSPGATVAPGASTTFQITFTPSVAGTRTATVSIASNDANQNPFTFTISGTAQIPHADQVWIDSHTGLMWQKWWMPTSMVMGWANAVTYCDELELADFSDWRMPTRDEYIHIMSNCQYNAEWDMYSCADCATSEECHNFGVTPGDWTGWSTEDFWTGTEFDASQAWFVQFYTGAMTHSDKTRTDILARCVRGQ